jgi:NADH-quinone oxidoreductase subunit H
MTYTGWFIEQFGQGLGWFLANLTLILAIAFPVMVGVAMAVYADRKIWAAMQLRRGPNVVGPFGLLQTFADAAKLFLKETIIPSGASTAVFLIAPMISFVLALVVWAVMPFDAGLVLADLNVGLLYVFAVSSMGVYGIIMSGWASNSKYAFLGGLRSAAQMVSYEVSMGFILVAVMLYAQSLNLSDIVMSQKGNVLGVLNGNIFNPLLFPMAIMFFITALAETNRPPFDLPEAEAELVAGYQVEYSSMSFALFFLGEYANILFMCALIPTLFLGGWLPPLDWAPLYWIPGFVWFLGKMAFMFFVFAWVKATVPRYRYDQLMRLGWKVFLPLSLFWVVVVSGWLMFTKIEPQRQAERAAYGALRGTQMTNVFACSVPVAAGSAQKAPIILVKHSWIAGMPEPQRWQVANGEAYRAAKPLRVETTSLGGSTGLAWQNSAGEAQSARIDWSDIVSDAGPESATMELTASGARLLANCRPVSSKGSTGRPNEVGLSS